MLQPECNSVARGTARRFLRLIRRTRRAYGKEVWASPRDAALRTSGCPALDRAAARGTPHRKRAQLSDGVGHWCRRGSLDFYRARSVTEKAAKSVQDEIMGLLDNPMAYVRDVLEGDVAGVVLISAVHRGSDHRVLQPRHPPQRDLDVRVGVFAPDPAQ